MVNFSLPVNACGKPQLAVQFIRSQKRKAAKISGRLQNTESG